MLRKTVKVNDWLKGNCPFKGCLHNDNFGSCLIEDTDFVDEMLDIVHESYKDNEEIPDDKTFICVDADFTLIECEYCGSELTVHKEYPDGGKQFLPIVYDMCSNKNCKGSAI